MGKSYFRLKNHFNTKHKEKPVNQRCFFCDYTYKSLPAYQKHRRVVHGFKAHTYPCNQCNFVAPLMSLLKKHIGLKHCIVEDFAEDQLCMLCEFRYRRLADYRKHRTSVHGFSTKNYQCNKCAYIGKKIFSLQNHMDTVHGGRLYPCHQCDFISDKHNVLQFHIDSVHNEIIHQCDQCGAVFSSTGNLRKHHRALHDDFLYKCDQCEFEASRPESLKNHKDKVHAGILYYCDECPQTCGTKAQLKTHKETKHEDHKFFCSQGRKCIYFFSSFSRPLFAT